MKASERRRGEERGGEERRGKKTNEMTESKEFEERGGRGGRESTKRDERTQCQCPGIGVAVLHELQRRTQRPLLLSHNGGHGEVDGDLLLMVRLLPNVIHHGYVQVPVSDSDKKRERRRNRARGPHRERETEREKERKRERRRMGTYQWCSSCCEYWRMSP